MFHGLQYGQKTKKKQVLRFVESVVTSVCGGAHMCLRCELVSRSWENVSYVCLSERQKHMKLRCRRLVWQAALTPW